VNWTTAAPAVTTAFLSSLVEAVEALTIVLAVTFVRGWRPAGIGAINVPKADWAEDRDSCEAGKF
jgi:uncharacterized membrane protein